MSLVAYGLRADYDGTVTIDGEDVPRFLGGVIRAGDRDLNVREELARGSGRILVSESDAGAVLALDGYPALKRVPAGDADRSDALSRYDALRMPELRAEVKLRGLSPGGSHDELVARLQAHDAAVEDGDAILAADPTPESPSSEDTLPGDAPPDYPADAEPGAPLDSSPEPAKGGNTPQEA